MRRMLVGLAVAIATFAGGGFGGLVGVAGAAPIACGTQLMASTVLQADVGPCATDHGLGIYADNVVLDLNGHKVFGTAERREDIGIFVAARNGAVVRNGTVTGFRDGVYAASSSNTTITGMTVVDNIGVTEGSHAGAGIVVSLGDNNAVIRSIVRHNGPTAGIQVAMATRTRIEGNVIVGNNIARSGIGGHGEILGNDDMGIYIVSGPLGLRGRAEDNQILDNIVRGNGSHGLVTTAGSDRTIVRGNDFSRNGNNQHPLLPDAEGIWVKSSHNRVTGNNVMSNSGSGIRVTPRYAIVDGQTLPVDGLDNRMEGNLAVGNGHGPYFGVDLVDDVPNCDDNIWSGNVFVTAVPECAAG
ncbi:MAG: right-handed parallel beta-helix repeat-containing protein [Acidimicrobiales bacterium]